MGLAVGMVFRVTRVPDNSKHEFPWTNLQRFWPTVAVTNVSDKHYPVVKWSDLSVESSVYWKIFVKEWGLEPILAPVEEDLLWD